MARFYLDSSVLVSIVLGDSRGRRALAILGTHDLCTSELSAVECQSGLSAQAGGVPAGLPAAEKALNAILNRMHTIQLTSTILVQARILVRRHRSGIGLRTLDALHIASCVEVQAQLGPVEYVTGDRRQHDAFLAEGFSGVLMP